MNEAQAKTELILDSSDDDIEQVGLHSGQESYRSEIEDIVKGFILEKDLMSQGHEEELIRMKQSFEREKTDLLRHLEEERDVLRHNSRMTSVTSNETGYISGSHDSNALHLNLYGGEINGISDVKRESNGLASARQTIDDSLVKEIAEVYLRMNNGMITSRIRPDLDIEDKFEREREVFERKFISEKREMKRKLEEEYNYKLEQEKSRFESQIQELKSTITDLQWQKRELESKNRNEKEKSEINFERERNEIEKRHLQMVHDMKRKIEEKHSQDITIQRDQYEENISELQTDISKLTTQLRELNENLRQEKEIIMTKFEREVKEMEQTFAEQRNSIKLSLEAEFSLRLENETSVFKTINKKIQDDLENLEREKKEYERKQKEERRKIEEHYEEEISEMEKRHSEEKRNIKIKLEERYHQMITSEKTASEVTVNELREEIVLLRQDNSQIEIAFDNRNTELRRQLEFERDETRKKFHDAENEIKIRLENEFSQKIMSESSGNLEFVQQLDRDLGMMKARYGEVEGAMITLRQERDMLAREREEMQRKLMNMDFEMERRKETPRAQNNDIEIDRLKEIIRNKDQEIATSKLQKEQIEISMSGLRREKMDLEDEVSKLKRSITIPGKSEDVRNPSQNMNNGELVSLQQNAQRKDEEMETLKRDKFELDSRISSLQRKNEELEDELSALRRKKLEVEDEISSTKRDKSDADNQISILRKEKMDLDENIIALKRKQAKLEDDLSALQRENMNKDHEISLLKRTIDTLKDEISILKQKLTESANENAQIVEQYTNKGKQPTSRQRTDSHHSKPNADNYKYMEDQITKENVQNVFSESHSAYDDLNESLQSIEQDVEELVRQKKDLQHSVKQLKDSKAQLERNIAKLEKHHGKKSPDHFQQQLTQREIDDLEKKKRDLEIVVERLEDKKEALEKDISTFEGPKGSSSRSDSFSQPFERDFGYADTNYHEPEYNATIQRNRGTLQRDQEKLNRERSADSQLIQDSKREIEELESKKLELENVITQLEDDKDIFEREIAELTYEQETAASLNADQQDNLEDTLAKLKDECTDLEGHISRLRREESGLEGHIDDLKFNEQDLNKRIRDLGIDEQRVQKDILRLKEEKNTLDKETQNGYGEGNTSYGHAQQGNGRRFTGISQVSIERVRKHDNKDHELAELRKERDSLKKEIAILKKNMDGKNGRNYQNQRATHQRDETNGMNFTNDMRQIEQNEVVSLKKERLEIEKTVATLQRQKTENNAEIAVIIEVKRREEDELSSLRRERIELETKVTTLQSKKTRLEAELSVIMDEMKRDDDEVKSLRRKKNDIETEFYDLQSKKTKLEADLTMVENTWKKKDKTANDFHRDAMDVEQDLKAMKKERIEIDTDIKRLQSVRSREEHELSVLRKQFKELEKQISDLKATENITRDFSVNLNKNQDVNSWERPNAAQDGRNERFGDSYDKDSSLHPPLSPGRRVRTSIEIPYVAVPGPDGHLRRSFDASESETVMIPDSEAGHLQPENHNTPLENSPEYNAWFTDRDDHVTKHSSPNLYSVNSKDDQLTRHPISNQCPSHYRDDHATRQPIPNQYSGHYRDDHVTRHSSPNRYSGNSFNNENKPGNVGFDITISTPTCSSCGAQTKKQSPDQHQKYPGSNQDRNSQEVYSVQGYNSQLYSKQPKGDSGQRAQWDPARNGYTKEDNDVIFLRREKTELQSQISELRGTLKKLQVEINELENLKMVNETLNVQSGSYQHSELDLQKELKAELNQVKIEV